MSDEPVVVHCYTTAVDVQNSGKLAALGSFCRTIGRKMYQGEVGLIIGDESFAIHDFTEE